MSSHGLSADERVRYCKETLEMAKRNEAYVEETHRLALSIDDAPWWRRPALQLKVAKRINTQRAVFREVAERQSVALR